MPKKAVKKPVRKVVRKPAPEVAREKADKAMAVVLQATGLSQLKPIKPVRKKVAPAQAKPKPKARKR